MYYYSLTDMIMIDAMKQISPAQAARFHPMMCGFNPTDKSSTGQISFVLDSNSETRFKGLGAVFLRCSEVTRLTNGPVSRPGDPAFAMILEEAKTRKLPVIISHSACSEARRIPRVYEIISVVLMPMQFFSSP